MKIQFLGAAKVVTGSNYLITTDKYKILLDCGLFQGSKEIERLNYMDFEYDPAQVDFLILSHAHIDHSGRIPKLVKEGFNGEIISTKATKDLCDIMLVDSGHIQEADVMWENKKRKRAGKELIDPLYTIEDAKKSLKYFHSYLYDQKIELNDDISIRFKDAGHILGSSIIELWINEHGNTNKIVFTGDLGMKNRPILRNPSLIEEADYLIMESTYGNRNHKNVNKRSEILIDIINSTVKRGGTVIIPSFAVGRTQELIYELNKYYDYNNDIEEHMKVPIYIDSPMAVSATDVFKNNTYCFDDEAKDLILNGDNPFEFGNLNYIRDQKESIRLNTQVYPKVIISASGMCTAGRVRHHLKHNLWNSRNSVVFVGYQAEGTLGSILKNGAKKVKLLSENISVSAQIHSIEGFSGHADKDDLLDWLKGFKKMPKKVFIVHGEEQSAKHFAKLISDKYNLDTVIPHIGYLYETKNNTIQTTTSKEILKPLKRKQNIKNELQKVYNQFENLALKTDKLIDDKLLKDDYDKLKNKLLELEQKLLDINMLIGK